MMEGYGIYLSDSCLWVGRFGVTPWCCDALRFATLEDATDELNRRGYRNSTNAEPGNAFVGYLRGNPRGAQR